MPGIDDEFLEMMECPIAHTPLVRVDEWLYSTDRKTRRKYRIQDGFPIMKIEDSQVADPEEFERVMAEDRNPRETPAKEIN